MRAEMSWSFPCLETGQPWGLDRNDSPESPRYTNPDTGGTHGLIVRRFRSPRRVRRAAARFLRRPAEAGRALRPAWLLLLPGRGASLDAARYGAPAALA